MSMVPTVGPSPGEQKTKPYAAQGSNPRRARPQTSLLLTRASLALDRTQHSVKELRSLGLTPDFIVCRSKEEVRAICTIRPYTMHTVLQGGGAH